MPRASEERTLIAPYVADHPCRMLGGAPPSPDVGSRARLALGPSGVTIPVYGHISTDLNYVNARPV